MENAAVLDFLRSANEQRKRDDFCRTDPKSIIARWSRWVGLVFVLCHLGSPQVATRKIVGFTTLSCTWTV